jgi:hypothetical protein
MTFAGVSLIKYLEAVIALYALGVGLLFLLDSTVLSAAVYAPWREFGALGWGLSLVLTSTGHGIALWLNGRNRVWSRTVRAVANFSHFYISLKFAAMFIVAGAPWGFMTFFILMPGLILPVLASTIEDAREAAHGRSGV